MTKPSADELTFAQRTALVELEQAATAPDPGDPPKLAWPTLDPAALYGLPGDVVRATGPYTEADPNAVLFAFLAWAGCYLGGDAYLIGGNRPHPARFWPILTGKSSTGRKGVAIAVVREVAEAVDPIFWAANRVSGLSSSEGLIKRVRDGNASSTNPDAKDFDEGVTDKRLLVVEEELANVFTRSRREGSSLSGTVREAYDGGTLQTLTSGNPMKSTEPHIVIVGAITPDELVEKLTATDITNGFANRFGIVCSRRSKKLPDGGGTPYPILASLGVQLRAAATASRTVRRLERTTEARELWADEYHRRGEGEDPRVLEALLARWAPHATRLSLIYALLDGADAVGLDHVRAGLAAWDYVEASTRYVFGAEESDPDLGRLVEFVDAAEIGRTREQISADLFQRHKTKAQLDDLVGRLLALGRYRAIKVPPESGRGRPRVFYVRVGAGSSS